MVRDFRLSFFLEYILTAQPSPYELIPLKCDSTYSLKMTHHVAGYVRHLNVPNCSLHQTTAEEKHLVNARRSFRSTLAAMRNGTVYYECRESLFKWQLHFWAPKGFVILQLAGYYWKGRRYSRKKKKKAKCEISEQEKRIWPKNLSCLKEESPAL